MPITVLQHGYGPIFVEFTKCFFLYNFTFKILTCLAFPFSESYLDDCIRCMPELKKNYFSKHFIKLARLNNLCPTLNASSIDLSTIYNEKMKHVCRYYTYLEKIIPTVVFLFEIYFLAYYCGGPVDDKDKRRTECQIQTRH